ncbi:riboflavin biosynthesis protein RibD [Helicobacter enhydrae]|uniref:Riboflavin biosynthesis protein RibD n=1 Tax=Helicobacter enhydrae TaxID=222136 RepID=A0A1B1U4F9_9HELI|nr:bifunctional diaminohydroxyphosphoribosylaminopyrimidine deaminase/5-amino-6-(5-phosphoribosylamino)uracil reductase RibD [Helicobacter enhydrae]ANV97638.1 riboflavin biosynthesis protein RibD [Helicobacter enhydrae]
MKWKFYETLMSLAIAKAWETQTLALPNPSVGALILSPQGEILALCAHHKAGEAHAELLAAKEALMLLRPSTAQSLQNLTPKQLYDFIIQHHDNAFNDCLFFVTLEPCNHYGKTPPCSTLLSHLKPKAVIIGANESNPKAQGGIHTLNTANIDTITGVLQQQCQDLLYPFSKFQHQGFLNLFKIAQNLNGSYTHGQISNPNTKAFTHSQRSVATRLIISGNTIIQDKPRLDVRCAYPRFTQIPQIQILTRQHLTPQMLECIQAPSISIHSSIDSLNLTDGFNIIEGGYALLESLKHQIDLLLVILSADFGGTAPQVIPQMQGEVLHTHLIDHPHHKDMLIWIKP